MASGTDNGIELACFPDAIAPDQRPAHFALIKELFGEPVRERADLPNGYAFRFPPDAFDLVVRFVANERKCCPFLNFDLTLEANSGPLWLRLTGPASTRAALNAELDLRPPQPE